MSFVKNKKYCCILRQVGDDWIDENPLFICLKTNKGLYPIYRTSGRYGVMNKNYHGFKLRDLSEEWLKGYNYKPKGNKTTKNILNFEEL